MMIAHVKYHLLADEISLQFKRSNVAVIVQYNSDYDTFVDIAPLLKQDLASALL